MNDRTEYFSDYYQRNRARISERERDPARREMRRAWRHRNRHILKIVHELGVTVAQARLMERRCLICRGKIGQAPGVCSECGEILLAMSSLDDQQTIVTAELLLSARQERQ